MDNFIEIRTVYVRNLDDSCCFMKINSDYPLMLVNLAEVKSIFNFTTKTAVISRITDETVEVCTKWYLCYVMDTKNCKTPSNDNIYCMLKDSILEIFDSEEERDNRREMLRAILLL